jgi:hypothetical protein
MASWINRFRVPIALATIAATASVVGVYLSRTISQERPLLVGYRHDSRTYFRNQGQGWLTKPAAAAKAYRWKMQEAAGNITDDLSGDSAVLTATGTLNYSLHTPIPMSGGFTRKAIGFSGAAGNYFDAADPAVGNQTTNNFSISGWLYSGQNAAYARIAAKMDVAVPNTGWEVAQDTTPVLYVRMFVGPIPTICSGVVSSAFKMNSWHYYTVNFNRVGNAYAYIDGADTGVVLNIAACSATLSNATNLRVGQNTAGGVTPWNGSLSEVMVADGLTTLAEHQAMYKAFKVPSGITYAQTSTAKYPIASVDGFGAQLGAYGGSAVNPQWPVMYDATLIDAINNPSGLGFPTKVATTNTQGRVSECTGWSLVGTPPTCSDNTTEAPDGTLTADTLTLVNAGDYIRKTAVGGGSIAPGTPNPGRCCSVYIKKLSGTCTALNVRDYGHNLSSANFAPTTEWVRYSLCRTPSGWWTNGCSIYGATVTNCAVAISDWQHEETVNLTSPCTSTSGDVSQTCNASYYSQIVPNTSLMPLALSRGEVEVTAATTPYTRAVTSPRTIWSLGNGAASVEASLQPSFVLKDQGGQVEASIRSKPLGISTEKRTYIASWDTSATGGLTDTSPRKYAALAVNGVYGIAASSPRNHNATSQIPYLPINQRDLYSNYFYVGCDGTGANCSQGVVEKAEWYARPAQTPRSDDSNIYSYVTNGASYLGAQAIPRFEIPTGATSANTWIWDYTEFSGKPIDRINGIELTASGGVPVFQNYSGLLARGNGRRTLAFISPAAGDDYIQAASTSVGLN